MPKQTLSEITRELDREFVSLREKLTRCTGDVEQLQTDYRSLVEANAHVQR